jgi:hypothetical protein
MRRRQAMLWIVGTRLALDRWEEALAEWVDASSRGPAPSALIWRIEVERHFAIVAANSLVSAVRIASRAKIVPELDAELAKDIVLLRHLNEHWDTQIAQFSNRAKPELNEKSARQFAKRHPGTSPHEFLGWNSHDGPTLGPGVRTCDLRAYMDRAQDAILAASPELAVFLNPAVESPWLGDDAIHPWDHWWPRARQARSDA